MGPPGVHPPKDPGPISQTRELRPKKREQLAQGPHNHSQPRRTRSARGSFASRGTSKLPDRPCLPSTPPLRGKTNLLRTVSDLGPAHLPTRPSLATSCPHPLTSTWSNLFSVQFPEGLERCLVSEPLYTLSPLPRTSPHRKPPSPTSSWKPSLIT